MSTAHQNQTFHAETEPLGDYPSVFF
jgi:hypothetical protein